VGFVLGYAECVVVDLAILIEVLLLYSSLLLLTYFLFSPSDRFLCSECPTLYLAKLSSSPQILLVAG
jgi:hypothetical protein